MTRKQNPTILLLFLLILSLIKISFQQTIKTNKFPQQIESLQYINNSKILIKSKDALYTQENNEFKILLEKIKFHEIKKIPKTNKDLVFILTDDFYIYLDSGLVKLPKKEISSLEVEVVNSNLFLINGYLYNNGWDKFLGGDCKFYFNTSDIICLKNSALVFSSNFMETYSTASIPDDVISFGFEGNKVVVAAKNSQTKGMKLYTSLDGKKYDLAEFMDELEQDAYTVLEGDDEVTSLLVAVYEDNNPLLGKL